MTDVTVSYKRVGNTGFIEINNTKVPTSDFLIAENKDIKFNDDDNKFFEFQKQLRYLDCVKDAMINPNVSDSVQVIYDQNFIAPSFKPTLDVLKSKFIKHNEQLIKSFAWTKKTKDSKLEPLLENRVVFKESGLNPEYFISPLIKYVGNIATEIIDPAGRSGIENKDIKFPENNKTLFLQESFLNLFGFENCSIKSVRIGNNNYKYQIQINSLNQVGGINSLESSKKTINRTSTKAKTAKATTAKAKTAKATTAKATTAKATTAKATATTAKATATTAKATTAKATATTTKADTNTTVIDQDQNINITSEYTTFAGKSGKIGWFLGNKEKNTLIKNKPLTTNVKRAIFFAKEMGDVLQVLIMFIWSKLNSNQLYSITTCDEVVYLLCMILQINCILTYAEKTQNKKMRTIDVFEPSANTPEKAKSRFISTKNSIIDHNTKFIDCLQKLKLASTPIYTSGVNEPIIINDNIYTKFISDLTRINDLLKTQNITDNTSVEDIDKFIKLLKVNFTFIEFIKIHNNRVTITLQSIYTTSNKLWIDVINPSVSKYKYGKKSFYDLIRSPDLIVVSPVETPESVVTPVIQVQPPNILTLTSDEIADAIQLKFNELIKPVTNIASGGGSKNTTYRKTRASNINNSRKRKITSSVKYSPSFLKSIEYLEYPTTASFYDKDNEETYDLYEGLIFEIHTCLKRINMDSYFNDVYNLLLHYFYLKNEVIYGEELFNIITNLFAKNESLPTRRRIVKATKIIKPSSRQYNSPEKQKVNAFLKISPKKENLMENIFNPAKRIKYFPS